jgi:hypothetical protein
MVASAFSAAKKINAENVTHNLANIAIRSLATTRYVVFCGFSLCVIKLGKTLT